MTLWRMLSLIIQTVNIHSHDSERYGGFQATPSEIDRNRDRSPRPGRRDRNDAVLDRDMPGGRKTRDPMCERCNEVTERVNTQALASMRRFPENETRYAKFTHNCADNQWVISN